jgi:hypothetical protein
MKNINIKNFLLKFLKDNYLIILFLFLLVPIYFLLYKLFIPRISAFGCFDDCNNFIRGYFVLSGKSLFKDVFSGHQPLGSYMSTLVQLLTTPENIYELILRHRQFILLFGFIFNAILIVRFGARIILFTIIFEFSKFYLFGDRFLAENMIIYPLVYLLATSILRIKKSKIYLFDYILSAIFCWFIVFAREPYIPLALLLYLITIWDKLMMKKVMTSLFIFGILSLVTILLHDVKEYFFNVITFNFQINVVSDLGKTGLPGPKILQIFFYPIYILFYLKHNVFSNLLLGIDIIFILYFLKLLKDKSYKFALLIFLALGLANIRVIFPGIIFYYSFHMLVWYGILVFVTCYLLVDGFKNRILYVASFTMLFLVFALFILYPNYFGWEKINQQDEFINNYGTILQEGEVIKILSNREDSLFLDGSDDLIYWQAKRFSDYKYSWYTSSMPNFSRFTDERIKMFKENPPDFYREYGFCPKKNLPKNMSLPEFVIKDYVRLESDGKDSCLFVRKEKLKDISQKQWDDVLTWHFELPNDKANRNSD